MLHGILNWLYALFGLGNLSGPNYGFWSGVGSDISEAFPILGLAVVTVRRSNCEVHGCWRLSHRTTAAGHKICRHHGKSLGDLTHADVIEAHEAALADDSTQSASTGGA